MIGKGSLVRVSKSDDVTGTVIDIKNDFAQVILGSKLEWIQLDDLVDMSEELLNRLIEGDVDSPLKFILATDANRLLTKYKFDPYVLATSTRITIYPHQIDEVKWGIDNHRIMIADEVGLGKTIIAALIVSELKARGLADKVLYVVPKSLVLKWQDELETKFDTKTTILKADYIKVHDNPFGRDRYDYVTSMDFLKQENRRRLIKKFDMVVVDEAHKFKPRNDRYELGEILSANANFMIFLTATPHDGKDDNFLGRMQLLDPMIEDIDSASNFWKRHVKEDVVDMDGKQVFPERKSETVDTLLTNKERRIHQMIDSYVKARSQEARNTESKGAVRFLATILKKRATSSLHSLRSTLERRHEKLGTVNITGPEIGPDDIEHDNDYEDRRDAYENVWTGGDIEDEKRSIVEIISAIDDIGVTDSKFDKLMEFIKKIKSGDAKSKILLFTEYRDTAEYLEERIGNTYRTGRINGRMDIQSRKDALEEFSQEDGPEILLCTDAAGEGVDMQFCNVEFNYDIPWNPNRLEQRMGRIHRIGQTREVHYYNFVVDKEDTIDGMIHGMLLEKIERIKEAMGNDSVFDILGRIISENMISEIYEELYLLPQKLWKPKIKAKIEEIEKTRKLVQEKIGSLLNGSKLNPQIYKDIQKIKRRAVDSGDIRRFLEIWTASNDGRYRENDGRIDIIVPAHMARRIGGSLKGTLDVEMARKFNIPYLALGNKKVQAILEDATKGSIAALGHPKKSGLLCVYNRSVVDGDGHKRNSETVMVFCNEDMTTSMVDVASVWDYAEVDALDGVTNSNRIAMMKEKADEEVCKDSEKFYNKQVSKLNEMCQKAKDTIDMYVATKVERHTESIDEWKSKIQTAPHYERLIKQARNKAKNVRSDGEKRKTEIDRRFKSELEIVLVGLATVAPQADYNARMMSDIAGMTIVLEHERKRANTDEERDLVKDVSGRDTGYDISTKYRCIEVKSFEGYPNPILTSHEWETARKHGDTYWLYVVENVHSNHKIHKIQDPYKVLAPLITQMEVTECRYTFNWVEWMRTKDGDTL